MAVKSLTGRQTVPQIFVGGLFLGGSDDLLEAIDNGRRVDLTGSLGLPP